MQSADAFAQAKLQELVRFTDLYLAAAMFPLFRALRGVVDAAGVGEALKALRVQLQVLEHLLAAKPADTELPLDLADAALLPVIWYAVILGRHFAGEDVLAGLPATQAWWQRGRTVPAAATVLAEMEAGLRAAIPVLFERA
jgi:glutathione S-transferase